METVMVTPKFQIVIPAKVRRTLDLQPGQRVQVIVYDNRIELIPVRPITEALGLLAGLDTTITREPDLP
jgi:AbrB family looped-hinge helix DNA binding protein